MKLLEAHAMIFSHYERFGADKNLLECEPEDSWPLYVTAAASLSGDLDRCETAGDLREAALSAHCDGDELTAEAERVYLELCAWAESVENN